MNYNEECENANEDATSFLINYVNDSSDDADIETADHLQDYVTEVGNFISFHDAVSAENCIEINKFMQQLLLHFKQKLEKMLWQCQEQYKINNQWLIESANAKQNVRKKNAFNAMKFCGAPFFKDKHFFSAPPNDDYLYRSRVLKELFPIDIKANLISLWTVKDKIALIQGVKSQAIDYMENKNIQTALKYNSDKNKILSKEIAVRSNLLIDLLKKVDSNFQINWHRISTENLGNRHPEHCCRAMWNMYLKPELSRDQWTDNENKKLLKVAEKNLFQNWEEIAQEMKNRSSYQCILQFQTNIAPSLREKNRKWTKEEDKLLKEAVESSRVGDVIPWTRVASHFPHKTKTQVYVRYRYSLDPNIKKGEFSKEEDCIILAAIQEYGEDFRMIPRSLFPDRNISQVKGRYFNVLKHNMIHRAWSPEDDKKLLELVEKYGSSNWVAISKDIRFHSRTSCRTRYNTIQKYLKNYPDKTIEDLPRKRRGITSDITADNWIEKIVELKTHGDKKKQKRKQTNIEKKKESYRERRRSLQRDYYEFFKYSYDFKFNEGKSSILDGGETIPFLQHLLNIHIKLGALKENHSNQFTNIERKSLMGCLKKGTYSLKVNRNFSDVHNLPPSWCTILGLRAVCIQLSSETVSTIENEDESDEEIESDLEKFQEHKLLFKQRFFTVFYKTALLSKISPFIREINDPENNIEPLLKRRKMQNKQVNE